VFDVVRHELNLLTPKIGTTQDLVVYARVSFLIILVIILLLGVLGFSVSSVLSSSDAASSAPWSDAPTVHAAETRRDDLTDDPKWPTQVSGVPLPVWRSAQAIVQA
jgi:hypothetical protein